MLDLPIVKHHRQSNRAKHEWNNGQRRSIFLGMKEIELVLKNINIRGEKLTQQSTIMINKILHFCRITDK